MPAIAALFLPACIDKAFGFARLLRFARLASTPEVMTVLAIAAEIGSGLALILGIWLRLTEWLFVVFTRYYASHSGEPEKIIRGGTVGIIIAARNTSTSNLLKVSGFRHAFM